MFSYRRCLDALGAFLLWSWEVADLTLAIAQVIFGAILVWTVIDTIRTHHLFILAHGLEAFALVSCLRILVMPTRLLRR
jgi:hypothetical protein